MAGDRVADHADLLAHHTTEALALASAVGAASDAGARAPCGAVPRRSPEIAPWSSTSTRRAVRYRRRSSYFLPGSEEHGLTLLKLGRRRRRRTGDSRRRGDHAEAAAIELEAVGARRSAARAYGLVGNTYFQLGGADRMRAALERSLEILEPLPPGPEHVEIYGRMASLESMSGGSPQLALDWAEKASVSRRGAPAPARAEPGLSVARAHALRARRPCWDRGSRAGARLGPRDPRGRRLYPPT